MESQIIQDGQISSDTICISDLISICREILKQSIAQGNMDDTQQSIFIQKYQKFALEYPSVFNTIMLEKIFYVKPFKKYLEFKKKQPLVYTTSEQSVKDLCYYPIQLFKYTNPHYNENDYQQYKQQLYEDMMKYHTQQKDQLKTISKSVIEKQQIIKHNLIDNIMKLALQHQLNN